MLSASGALTPEELEKQRFENVLLAKDKMGELKKLLSVPNQDPNPADVQDIINELSKIKILPEPHTNLKHEGLMLSNPLLIL